LDKVSKFYIFGCQNSKQLYAFSPVFFELLLLFGKSITNARSASAAKNCSVPSYFHIGYMKLIAFYFKNNLPSI